MLLKGAASLFDLNIFFSVTSQRQTAFNRSKLVITPQYILFCSCSPGQKPLVTMQYVKISIIFTTFNIKAADKLLCVAGRSIIIP